MTVFQCLPSYRPVPTLRVISSIYDLNCRILLDLEDSIQDVINPGMTKYLKKQARVDLLKICNSLPDQQFDIRINALNTTERNNDEQVLEKINNISSVFIPKAESAKELEEFSQKFNHRYKLNIIIETLNGIHNLQRILNSKVSHLIEYVFFGNYDYHLNANIYPVNEQCHLSYWEIVDPIIKQVEENKVCFGNSPYAQIGDLKTLTFIVDQLNDRCRNNYAVMSLHRKQTSVYNSSLTFPDEVKISTQENEKELQYAFINKKLKGRSFALINSNNRVITPHEYLLLRSRNG